MNTKTATPRINDPAYLWGHLLATRALVLALAKLTSNQEDLLAAGTAALELLRTSVIDEPVPESLLTALNEFEAWLEKEATA